MYPLDVTLAKGIGFAVANDEDEHATLTGAGYVPALAAPSAGSGSTGPENQDGYTVESARAALDAAGIEYDARFGLAKLIKLLPQ